MAHITCRARFAPDTLLNALGFGYCLALVLALLVAGLVGTVIERPLLCRVYRFGTAILALSSSAPTTTFYTLRNGNHGADLTRFTLPGGLAAGGTDNTVAGGTSQDVRGLVFDPVNAKWYYGTAGGQHRGNFGHGQLQRVRGECQRLSLPPSRCLARVSSGLACWGGGATECKQSDTSENPGGAFGCRLCFRHRHVLP